MRRPVNDVFQYDGVTYFFSGIYYQVFDDRNFRVSITLCVYDDDDDDDDEMRGHLRTEGTAVRK